MLHYRSHWHLAFERDPFGEARLVRFAGPNGGGSVPAPDPEPEEEDPNAANTMPDPNSALSPNPPPPETTIPDTAKDTRGKVVEALSEKSETEQGVEKIETKAMELDSALLTLEKTIDSAAVRQYLKDNGKEAEMEEQMLFIQEQKAWVHTLEAHASDFVKWEKGALNTNEKGDSPVKQFVDLVKKLYVENGSDNAAVIAKRLDEYVATKASDIAAAFDHGGDDGEETYDDIERWESRSGKMPPAAFLAVIENHFGSHPTPEQQSILDRLEAVMNDPANDDIIRGWGVDAEDDIDGAEAERALIQQMSDIADTKGIKETIEAQRKIREELNKIARLDEILSVTGAALESRVAGMKKAEETLREIAAIHHRDYHDTEDHGSSHNLFGIKFYSALEVWDALKSVKEAYTTAWHDHSHHKSAELAKAIGQSLSWVPILGETANIALKKEQESHNEKQKNEFKDYLKSNNFKFKQLFGETEHDVNSLMHVNHHDPNKIRAILEFAGSKGWLYDLDLSAGSNQKKVFGHDLLDLLQDYDESDVINFYDSLRGENSSGRESEIKAAHDKVKDIENIPYFMIEIEREMKACNLWAAIGIASRAVERGLIGETIPWIMTTITRVLRENPSIRKFASVDFFDKLGALSLYHSDATMGVLKVARKDLYKWSQADWKDQEESDKALSKLGTALKVARDIEDHIKHDTGLEFDESTGPHSKAMLDRYVAQVLANQTVRIEGKSGKEHTFNIFDDRYDYFTQKTIGQGEVSVGKEDEDYYRETTANLRADFIVIKEIFRITSTGQFANDSRAVHYAQKILSLPEEMEAAGLRKEAKNFRKIMGRKLEQWYRAEVYPSRDRANAIMAVTVNGRCFLKEIFKAGFIDKKFLEDSIDAGKGREASIEILKEIDPTNSHLP